MHQQAQWPQVCGQTARLPALPWHAAALTDNKCVFAALQEDQAEAAQQVMLVEWGRKHNVRTALSISAFTAMIVAVMRAQRRC
jgi:hypothetical protein